MIFDALPYDALPTQANSQTAIRSFVAYIEHKLGIRALIDLRSLPFGKPALLEPLQMAKLFIDKGVIQSFYPVDVLPDEPRLKLWGCICNNSKKDRTGGASFTDDAAALYAALAEGLERYLWFTQQDYLVSTMRGTAQEISKKGRYIPPEQFVSFSKEQRKNNPDLLLTPNSVFLWTKANSLVSGEKIYIPAQTITASLRPTTSVFKEPLIKQQTTIGLATWPTQSGARLAGLLEIIEREALMIMWYNQLTLPKVRLSSLQGKRETLDALLTLCEQYRLKVHAIPMMTDSPTHAVCVILEDMSGVAPRFSLGLKANRSLDLAVEKATTEALRARYGYRNFFLAGNTFDPKTPVDSIGHIERLHYWGIPEHAKKLEFLIQGDEESYLFDAPWEGDSAEAHLDRLLNWCREKNFECVSVSLGTSKANPSPWHIEMVVMPDLHPTHLYEQYRHLGGTRLQEVPRSFGYTPRSTPYTQAPHPFA